MDGRPEKIRMRAMPARNMRFSPLRLRIMPSGECRFTVRVQTNGRK
jgi:hypothetical protein